MYLRDSIFIELTGIFANICQAIEGLRNVKLDMTVVLLL